MEAMTPEAEASLPEFTIAMRGYDRMQVDEYIARLGRWMDEAQARTAASEHAVAQLQRDNQELRRRITEVEEERGTPSAAFEGLGDRLERMIADAVSDCEEIRQRGVEEANAAVATARKTAVDIVERTRAAVRQLEDAAKDDRRRAASALGDAASEADAVVAERLSAADQEAARLVDEASNRADAMINEAEQRRVRIIEAGEQHRRSVEEDIARLVRQRDHVLSQLTGLRSALEGAISLPGTTDGAEGAAGAAGGNARAAR